jgi:nitrogen fixation NifU-like protein
MSELTDLYQEVILDHNRRPRNFGTLDGASHHAEGYNPLCGDRLSLFLRVDDGTPPGQDVEDLGKLSVLAGVREFPVRVKCASLAWHTLKAALEREQLTSTE